MCSSDLRTTPLIRRGRGRPSDSSRPRTTPLIRRGDAADDASDKVAAARRGDAAETSVAYDQKRIRPSRLPRRYKEDVWDRPPGFVAPFFLPRGTCCGRVAAAPPRPLRDSSAETSLKEFRSETGARAPGTRYASTRACSSTARTTRAASSARRRAACRAGRGGGPRGGGSPREAPAKSRRGLSRG